VTELIGSSVAIVLTIMVLSRIVGDNPAFRVAQYLFIGVSLGYAFVVVYHQVLRPSFIALLASAGNPFLFSLRVLPFVLGLFLLPRISGRQSFSWLANFPLALVFGVTLALAVGGALIGTLLPQILDSAAPLGPEPLALVSAIVLSLGVIAALCSFYFTVRADTGFGRFLQAMGRFGRWLLIIALGFFFAGAVMTYLSAFNERLAFILGRVLDLFR
jgi:FtsH-binding integral membrane protein